MLERAEPTLWHHPMPQRQLWIQKYVELLGTCPLGKDLTIKHYKWLLVLGWQILDVKLYDAWNITTTFICEETESFPKATSNYKIKEICLISITQSLNFKRLKATFNVMMINQSTQHWKDMIEQLIHELCSYTKAG